MIYGNGLLARGFKNIDKFHPNVVFLCSGVAGSMVVGREACEREYSLVKSIINTDKHFVYTSSFVTKQNAYFEHKLRMEELVKSNPNHTIVRIGNLVHNEQSPWQFFPSIVNQIKNGRVNVFDCRKDIIYLLDYVDFVDLLIRTRKSIVTSFGSKCPPLVSEIVSYIEFKMNLSADKIITSSDETLPIPEFFIPGTNYYKNVIDLMF